MSQDIFNLFDRVQAFDLDGYTKTCDGVSVQEGDFGTITQLDGDGLPMVKFDRLADQVCFHQVHLKPACITFQQAYDRFLPYTPIEREHTVLIPGKLKVYRHGNLYLSIDLNGLDVSFHKDEDKQIQESRGFQAFLEDAFALLDEYEETQKPVEVTLADIANKFNIPVSELRIKE